MLALIPCSLSAACCSGISICCSVASCFGCKSNPRLAKILYIFIFALASCTAIFLRYWGEKHLHYVSAITSGCDEGQCWGLQGAFRMSFATVVFFIFMTLLTFIFPITHMGGWLVKLVLFIGVSVASFTIPNSSMTDYAEAARVFSVVFLLAQVFIFIDFAYNTHEYFIAKMDEKDAELAQRNWQPGLCSNIWRVLYLVACVLLIVTSITGIGVMYKYFGKCAINRAFLTETLVIGILMLLGSIFGAFTSGLLPPSLIFVYNTYLAYGAITNNPDQSCNLFARTDRQNGISIFLGLTLAAASITWTAQSSAKKIPKVITSKPKDRTVNKNILRSLQEDETDPTEKPLGAEKSKEAFVDTPVGYQPPANASEDVVVSVSSEEETEVPGEEKQEEEVNEGIKKAKPWTFHVIMALAGFYIAMLTTNWASPSSINEPAGNPELSKASMWSRMGSQFAIHVIFLWTLIAPRVLKNRVFS